MPITIARRNADNAARGDGSAVRFSRNLVSMRIFTDRLAHIVPLDLFHVRTKLVEGYQRLV